MTGRGRRFTSRMICTNMIRISSYIELLFYFIFSSLCQSGIRLLCSALKVINVIDIWQLNNSIQHTILIMKYSSIWGPAILEIGRIGSIFVVNTASPYLACAIRVCVRSSVRLSSWANWISSVESYRIIVCVSMISIHTPCDIHAKSQKHRNYRPQSLYSTQYRHFFTLIPQA